MLIDILGLIISLAIILLSCELFTNGIEWLGKHLKLGDGVIGSIFSAVGTCLPETMIPIIALMFSGKSETSADIGIGAIIGAPFMLSTLAFFVTGISVLIFWKRRKTGMNMKVNTKILSRDIGFFIMVYSVSVITGIVTRFVSEDIMHTVKIIVAILLMACYVYYIILTVRQDKESHNNLDSLYIIKFLNVKPGILIILFQVAIALTGIVFGAELFVKNIEDASQMFGISAFVLSLIITPIATELPEKFNSIIWISKKKDTLALGNITGAMVFQSCFPVSVGLLATTWKLDAIGVASASIALLSSFFVFLWIKARGRLSPVPLVAGGVFYLIFIGYLILFTHS